MHKGQETLMSFHFMVCHDVFKSSFFPSIVIEWSNLGVNIWNSSSLGIFKRELLSFIRSVANSIFKCHIPNWIKFLTSLRLGLSPIRRYKSKHSFQHTLNPFYRCLNKTKHSRMDQVKFVENSFQKIWRTMVCERRPYSFKLLKGYFPQILLHPFLILCSKWYWDNNSLSHLLLELF